MANKNLNKIHVENLIKSGVFDTLGINRRRLYLVYDTVIFASLSDNRIRNSGQVNLFDSHPIENELEIPMESDFSFEERLEMEKNLMGVYISGNPIQQYSSLFESGMYTEIKNVIELVEYGELKDGDRVKLLCSVGDILLKKTKNGDEMAFVTVEDMSSQIEVIFFSDYYSKYKNSLKRFSALCVIGRISIKDDEVKILCEEIQVPKLPSKNAGLYVRFESQSSPKINQITNAISNMKGNMPIFFFFENEKKLVALKEENRFLYSEENIVKLKQIIGEKNVAIKE
jgi:DNA polymerase-3 subunit alpha